MGLLSRLFRRGKPSLDAFREDLTQLDVAAFLEKHAGKTQDSRMLMVAHVVPVLSERCTEEEKNALRKALVAAIGIEALDGWALTIGTLGTILGDDSSDPEIRAFIETVSSQAEKGLRGSGEDRNERLLEFLRIARTGDFEAILAFQRRFAT